MAQLLVSVRNSQEARTAVENGTSIVDIKEPDYGSLGRASQQTIAEIAEAYGSKVTISVAMGELFERSSVELPTMVAYTKFGLSRASLDWREQLLQEKRRLHNTNLVAVAYADHTIAASPPVNDVLEFAIEHRCHAFLIDTFQKNGDSLLVHMNFGQLRSIIDRTRASGVLIALAGSLTRFEIQTLLPLQPDIFAVRGAACDVGRSGTVIASNVRDLVDMVQNCCAIESK